MKMYKIREFAVILLTIVLVFIGCRPKQTTTANGNAGEYELVWSDEFDYTGLPDSAKWKYDTEGNEAGWGNKEAQ